MVRGFGGTGGGKTVWTIVRCGDLGGTGGGKAGEGKTGGEIRSGGWKPGKKSGTLAGAVGADPSSMRAYVNG